MRRRMEVRGVCFLESTRTTLLDLKDTPLLSAEIHSFYTKMAYNVIDMHLTTFNTPFIHVLTYQREEGAIYWGGVKTLENTVTVEARMTSGANGQLPP